MYVNIFLYFVNYAFLDFLFTGLGCTMMYISPLSINIPNFEPKSKGKVTGITFCSFYVGCTATSLTFYLYFCNGPNPEVADLSGYFLFQAFFQTFAVILCLLFLNHTPPKSRIGNDEFDDIDDVIPYQPVENEHKHGTVIKMVSSFNFYLIVIPFVFCSGITLVLYSNIIVYASSFGLADKGMILSVVQYVFSCVGALGTGFLSDWLLDIVPRSTFALATELPLAILYLLSIFFLYKFTFLAIFDVVGLILEGQCYMLASMMISDEFGSRHFGTNWGFTLFLSGVFTFFCEWIFSHAYDDQSSGEQSECYGLSCYTMSSMIFSCLLILSTILTSVLVGRKCRERKSIDENSDIADCITKLDEMQ